MALQDVVQRLRDQQVKCAERPPSLAAKNVNRTAGIRRCGAEISIGISEGLGKLYLRDKSGKQCQSSSTRLKI
ncbi:MAG: hypothetical protein EBU84_21735 [Actinobacteria bacterium]|nr:hypothetical protein [Actinomycetota bacterium]